MTHSTRVRALALLLATATCSFGALKPCGFMTDGRESRFVFADTLTGKRVTWIAVGQSFWDYSVVGFDHQQEILFIQRGPDVIPLGLKTTNIVEFLPPVAIKPVLISVPGYQSFSITADGTILSTVTEKLAVIAARTPQPIVTIYAPKDADVGRIRAAAKLVKAAGLTRINFALGQRNDRPGVLLK